MIYFGYALIALGFIIMFKGVIEANNMIQPADVRMGGSFLIVGGLVIGVIGCGIVALFG